MALGQGRGSAIVGIILVLVAIAAGSLQGAQAVQHVVGGSVWSLPSLANVNYTVWASQQTFKVGDTLLFNYSKAYHNVEQVSKKDFESCNFSSPLTTSDDGSTVISLTKAGTLYFICGVPGHCAAGQKVEVKVSKSGASPVPASGPGPSPSPALSPSSSPSPAGSPIGSAPSESVPPGSPASSTSSSLASPRASPPHSNAHAFKCTLALGWGLAASCLMILL